jgi:ATP-dependent Clp protease protease subunit
MFDLYADHCKFPSEDRETARARFGALTASIPHPIPFSSSLLATQIIPFRTTNADFPPSRLAARMLDRDHYLVPEAAIEQGIIDKVLRKRPATSTSGSEGESRAAAP